MSKGPLLLVNTNQEVSPEPVLPIGLLRVADACEAAGIPVQVLDLAFERRPQKTLQKAIGRHRPAMIGFGVRNLDNADALQPRFYVPFAASLVAAAKEAADVPTVAGGAGISIAPEACRGALGVDTIVAGPGELALPELFAKATAGEALPELVRARSEEFSPAPRFGRWLDFAPYRRRGASLSVQSRRGCPFHCVYCNYASIEGTTRYEHGEASAVVDAIRRELGPSRLQSVEFVDSTFNSPASYTRALCKELASADLGVGLRASGISPRFGDRTTLEALVEAGFEAIMCSPDAGAPATIEAWGKDFDIEHLASMASDSAELKLPVLWSFMFGGPGETEETVRDSVRFIREAISPDHPVMLTARMRVYPGTRLAEVAASEGRPAPALDPAAEGQFYVAPCLDPAWMDGELQALKAACPNVMFMDGGQARSIPWISAMRAFLRQRGPAWASYPALRRRLQRWGLE